MNGPRQIRLGLDRPRRLLTALGHPEAAFPVVLIAGSNGKGSTSTLLTSILHDAGIRVGWFRSPALESDRDEIGVGTEVITEADYRRIGNRVEREGRRVLEDGATPFEALTATAFVYFLEQRVDIAVLEAGMGGARDATNITDPALSMVTSVSLEHTDYLGDTVEAIARDKAGVFRPGRPALASSQTAGDGWPALEAEADRIGARLHDVAREVTVRGEAGGELTVETPVASYSLTLPLAGVHQRHNLALAVRAAELLAADGWERVGDVAIRGGVAAARLPGRLETIGLGSGRAVLLDAAHNPAAVATLIEHLDALRAADPARKVHLLFGVLQDKNADEMLPPLAARVDRVTLTRPSGSRGRDPRELLSLVETSAIEAADDPQTALDTALEALPPHALLVVTGSLALTGEIRRRVRALTDGGRSDGRGNTPPAQA